MELCIQTRKILLSVLALLVILGTASGPGDLHAQPLLNAAVELPFGPGEVIEYRVQLGSIGGGTATMRVGEPLEIRDSEVWPLMSNLRARVALAVVKERARSWLDPVRKASLRYHKQEHSPLSSFEERVEIFPDEKRWTGADAADGVTPSDAPLDELSFIYLIRSLPLDPGATYRFDRHFDPERNPVVVRVVGRERITVPAGTFNSIVAEMEVTDSRRFGGRGTIRFHFSDDARRIPLRIESSMPVVGRSVLSLSGWKQDSTSPR